MKITKAFVGLAVVVALIAAFNVFSFGQSGNEPRVTQQIDDSNLVRLYRNTRPEANFKNDRGAVADTYDIDHIWLQLQRSSEQEQELDQYIDQLNDRTSPNFHKWLTPEEYGQFGVAKEDIDKVVGWLEYHGFRVNQIYPNNMLIDFSGTAGQIHDAFHTSIHNLEVNGEQHIANMSDPMIPAALRPVVHSIASLHDFKPHPSMKQKGNYTFGSGANTDFALTPQDTAVIYNVAPLWNAGTSGQGQTIYIIEDEDTYNGTTDWTTYRNKFGLTTAFPSATYTEVHPGGCTDPGIVTTDGADGEAALDVEVSSSMAPNAAIELVSCKDTVTFGGLIALQNLVNAGSATASASVVSISYGICEAFNGNGGNQSFYNTYQQAASEGYSVFVSTGDEGSSSCSADFSAGSEYDVASIGVTGWGETPYNVAVGGIDYEDEYNALEGGSAQSTYWSGAFTGSVTSGSKTITATTATFYSCDVGLPVSGTGIATGATISSVTSTTQATLSANASATESGKTFYLASGCNVVTGSVSSGSPTLTTSSAVLSNANIGNTVAGTGIPSGAVITSVSSSTSATLSASATANETGETITLTGYGSAKSYIPEIPWNDSCASVLLSYLETASATTYGTSGFCNSSTGKADFLSGGAGSGGGSNCAQGNGGTDQGADGISDPQCQGWPKPSYQSGSSLSGGSAVYGQPTDAVRDIPDVSMFAANGVWGHYEIVCWSDTAESAYGGASCAGAPSTWSGFGGTSVAAPMMAGIQALVNQKTGDNWGNPNPIYYQIAQSEYGTQGGTFAGTTCNSSASGGPASTCVFNDVTQGDMDTACEYNGTLEEAHCYKPSSTYGVDSTDTITAGTVIYGGSGYTTAPTCTIAGPTNNSPYKFNGTTQVWAGGTQATCTATISGNTTTTAVWSVTMYSTTGVGQTIVLTNPAGTTTCGPYTLSGASTTAMASGLVTSIGATGANCSSLVATATSSSNVVTITAKTAGAAGNFITQNGTGSTEQAFNVYISNTTLGQGPYYVSGITINTPGSGYAPETPITLTGVGTGAVAVANSSFGTAASSYQPTYGAAPGYDLATGLGTVNAYNLANSSAWGGASITCTSVPSSAAYNSNFTISCSDTDGIAVSYYASSGGCSNSGATYTMTSPSTSCVIKVAIAQGSPATTYTVTATKASQTITVTTAPPGTAAYNSTFPVAATASSGLAVAITTSGSCSGSGSGSATITMTSGAGTCSVIFNQSGNTYYSAAATVTDTASATTASSTTGVTSSLNPSIYGQSISFSATVTGSSPSGTVQFYIDSTAFGSAVTLASGSATSISTSTLAVGTHTVTATYSGDTNNSGSTGTLSSGQTIYTATAGTISVTLTSGADPSTYGQSLTFTASIPGQYGQVKGRNGNAKAHRETVTGTVTWSSNTGCGTTTVTSGTPGLATCTTSILPVGSSDTVTANYSGDSNHSSGSGSVSQQVNQVASSTSVSSSLNPSIYGQSVSFSATVTGSSPTGTVQFYVDSTAFGSAVTLASGSATSISTSTLAVGTHTVTATYSGDTNNSGSTGTLSGGQTIYTATAGTIGVTLTSGADPSTYGQSLTFTASIPGQYGQVKGRNGNAKAHPETVTGTVAWSANTGCGTTTVTSGTPGLATCTTSILPVGSSDTVTANYSGDSNHSSGSGSVSQQVNQVASSTSVSSSLNPSIYGQSISFSATVTGSSPTGTVQFYIDSTAFGSAVTLASGSATSISTSTLAVGTHTVTATYSGDTNNSGSTGTLSSGQTIYTATAGTIGVTLTSGADPSTYGQSLTFTASIPGQYGQVKGRNGNAKAHPETVTGTVAWSSNTGCGTTTVTSGTPGLATCTTSILPVGSSDTVTANYSGDSNHSSGSGSVSQEVDAVSSSTSVSSSLNPSSYGQSVSFTATVTGNSPTGTVQFYVDSALFDTETLSSGSATSIGTSTLAAGTHIVTATYSGDTNNSGSTGTLAGGQVVSQATSSTAVTSSPNPSTYATSVTFTATINGANGLVKGRKQSGKKPLDVTGTVAWSSNTGCTTTTVTPTPPGSGVGVATCTTSSATHLPVGTDPVTATYSGDSNHSGSSGSVNQVVNGGIATSISVTSVSPSNEDFAADTPVTITAVLSWTGHGVAPTASDVTIGGTGNGAYGATSCSPRSGETITCTATYTPTNTDVAGNYTESASFSGDTNYAASSSSQTNNFTINQASATTAVTSSLNPSTYGQSVTLTATITGENNEVKGRKPAARKGVKPLDVTGSVAWTSNGVAIPDCGTDGTTPVTSGNPGVATCTTSSLGGGTDTVTATYSGDSNHGGSSGTLSGGQVVNPASQVIALSSVPASAVYNTSFTVVASASSGLQVAFSSSGPCSNSGATYTMTSGTGKCSVIVNQAGNANYTAAPQVTVTLNAVKALQTITVTEPAPASAPKGTVFTVAAVSSVGLPITYANQNDGLCTNSGPTFTLTGKGGTCFVSFNAAGNSDYEPNSVSEQTMIQAAAKPTVSFTGAPPSAAYQSTFTVSATSNSTSTPAITAAGACSISGTTVTMTLGTGTCTLTAKWAANDQYLAASATQKTTAEKLTSTVTWATPAPITYGTKLSATQLNATANVAGKFVYSPKSGTTPAVPTPPATCDTLTVTFTPTLAEDYTTATGSVCLVVNPAQ